MVQEMGRFLANKCLIRAGLGAIPLEFCKICRLDGVATGCGCSKCATLDLLPDRDFGGQQDGSDFP
jgi:hypothetical protein